MNLLVSDLDGTLLNKDGSLPQNIEKLIKKLKEKEYVFSIGTARSPQNVFNLFKSLDIDYIAFCSDGAITINKKDNQFSVISEDFLTETSLVNLDSIFAGLKKYTKLYFSNSDNDFKIYIENDGNISEDIFANIFPYRKWEFVPSFSISDSRQKKIRAFSLFTDGIVCIDDKKESCYQYITYKETRFFNERYYWHDFLPKNTSKGNAIKKQIQNFNNIIALGNGENDIEMFKVSDNSFCPNDSHINLKAISRNIILEECGESFINQVIHKL
jgi:hydroxymethylpyrimidine pyrophosphatase-like HAD family hydrolase